MNWKRLPDVGACVKCHNEEIIIQTNTPTAGEPAVCCNCGQFLQCVEPKVFGILGHAELKELDWQIQKMMTFFRGEIIKQNGR